MDGKNNVKLTVKWLKDEDGDEWAVRIEGEGIDPRRFLLTRSGYVVWLADR